MGYRFGAEDAVFVVGETGEDLVGRTVDKTDECDPFLLVVLEADDVCLKLDGSLGDMWFDLRCGVCFLLESDKHT